MHLFDLCRWEELVTLVNQRDGLLKAAEEVHKFITDASETNDRMNEKVRWWNGDERYSIHVYV